MKKVRFGIFGILIMLVLFLACGCSSKNNFIGAYFYQEEGSMYVEYVTIHENDSVTLSDNNGNSEQCGYKISGSKLTFTVTEVGQYTVEKNGENILITTPSGETVTFIKVN